jgi:hypothetical protein
VVRALGRLRLSVVWMTGGAVALGAPAAWMTARRIGRLPISCGPRSSAENSTRRQVTVRGGADGATIMWLG